ncbi:fumarate hydratase, partial [Magnetococcales bacterium HHB-1]
MTAFQYTDILPLGEDQTTYRQLSGDYVSVESFGETEILRVSPEGLTTLAREAMHDLSHLLRPGHLQQLQNILNDPEASDNDRYVAFELLKNANTAAGMVLPSCQDTGTAVVMGKKGEQIFTGCNDKEALSQGIFQTYTRTNLR